MLSSRLRLLHPRLYRVATSAAAKTTGASFVTLAHPPSARRKAKRLPRRSRSTFAPRHGKAIEPATLDKAAVVQQQLQDEQDGDVSDDREVVAAAVKGEPGQKRQLEGEPGQKRQLEGDLPEERLSESEGSMTKSRDQEQTARASVVDDRLEQKAGQSASNSDSGESRSKSSPATSSGESADASAQKTANIEGPQEAVNNSSSAVPEAPEQKLALPDAATPGGPLEAIMHMPAPAGMEESSSHPVMSPPRYVHHFDSYTLVKQLQEGGYSPNQSITFMKGIRKLLAEHLDVAQESLVSKSDVENETYLFRAACSELSTEIKNNRRLHDEHMRQQRTHLQHEVDNLTQTLNQELMTLRDSVKGSFNDRKMAVSEEQRAVDSAIQQITYKISIMLSSDSKSEIEGVRWILIRRSVLGIIFMAMLTLATLRYASYLGQERQREVDREKQREEDLRRDGGKRDISTAADAAVLLVEGGG